MLKPKAQETIHHSMNVMPITKIKRLFYAYSFFNAFILIYPLYAVMFADLGLRATEISIVFIVWSVTAFLLEVPSGAIADKYPRKNVLIIAVLFQASAFACWLLWPTFWGILVGFLLWGINSALSSGTEEALIYDELKRAKSEKQYAKVTGKTEALDLAGTIGAGFGAAALVWAGYTPILMLSVLGALISAAAIALLPKTQPTKTTGETKYWSYLAEGIQVTIHNRKVLFLLLFMSIVTGLGAVDEYYNLLFHEQGLSNTHIALWMGAIFAVGAAGSITAHMLENKKLPLTLSLLIWAAILLLATLLPPAFAPLAIGLYVGLFYIIKVLFSTSLQHELNDKNRATATSVGGLFAELGALISFGIFAVIAEPHNYATAFQITAGVIALAGLLYGVLHRRFGLQAA